MTLHGKRAKLGAAGPIYFTAAACFASSSSTLLARLLARLQQYGSLASAGASQAMIEAAGCAERLKWIDDAELVVAEVTDADSAVGAEVMYALHKRRVPTLCLVKRAAASAAPPALRGLTHPLLTVAEYADADEAEALVDSFACPPDEPGRVFVIEGGDGAGKQTQTAMLLARLRDEGYPVATLDYPHDSALNGKLIRTLLSGSKGDIKSVNPLLFASLYAQNRADTAPLLEAWIKQGKNVILDRYVEANFG